MTAENASNPVQVRIAADQMSATLIIDAGLPAWERSPEALEAQLDERGVARSPERTAAVAAASAAAETVRVERVVALGRPPVHGRDASFVVSPGLTQPHAPKTASDGRVDYHESSSLVVVREGDLLGHLHPPVQGADGEDVTGRALVARTGRSLKLLFDETVRISAPDPRGVCEVRAACPGLLVRHGDVLRVSPTLDVGTDVDFSVGNIDFPGDVRIAGGVRDCFVVRAEGSIEVRGLVEAATLTAGLDVRLRSGMAGREKGSLSSDRDGEAKYLEGVQAAFGRDAAVVREITNSRVHVGRNLKAPTCSVVGGSLFVAADCEVAQFGSEARVATHLVLGKIEPIETLMRKGLRSFKGLEDRLKTAREKLEQIRKITGRMSASQAEQLTELEFGHSEAQTRVRALGEGLGRALAVVQAHAHPKLTVHRLIHPGVKIWLGRYLLEPRSDIRGPIELTLSPTGEPLIRLSSTADPEPAAGRFRVSPDDTYVDLHEVERAVHRGAAA